ncbi:MULTISPECIES: GntP family permease [Priestia]|jgi:gluconate:H+ symporter, GntP family|uniref:Citrate transporter family protein n=3 Tax=Priestia TaxID=2800373 RepID=D5DUC2_PRIM1|nr:MULTISPECIES: SLC13 family permease [Priestia]AVX08784.1 gluconate:proton symporter [Bacillus sp. Y-01]KOP74925.1 gluconate:proton symporter [Bacillus sp. FJAT-21351]KQU11805.1 gluconate:proton symporter [Bacillus sp. Leaf75]MDH6654231.1 GntP family gluconate:H+ symporter [Bacillus sp. PvP124]MDP9575650.1 GntP family gluconate:H+ symporter [Bacillus sp. 1751]RFB29287.1 GntP family permease [Bacillus sp. ALD]RFB41339.1 GntP family permease [Bacillus sp. RC]
MDVQVSALGAICALVIAIILILKKVAPAYGMIAGALIGGLIGGVNIADTVNLMIEGAQGIIPAVLRILAAGILAGVLIESGAAAVIAETIVKKLGETKALLALALATLILTTVGVFVDVAVITVAPIALAIAKRTGMSKPAILLAMIGGGKAGNLMSPNPNAIAASDAFNIPLTSVMAAGIIPAVFGVAATYLVAKRLVKKGTMVQAEEIDTVDASSLPLFLTAIIAPIVTIVLLALRPLFDLNIDPMVALPAGGIVGAIVMKKGKQLNTYAISGLGKMSGVAIMLLGTGTLAGIIANSQLKDVIIHGLSAIGLPAYVLAPVSGIFMSAATASTTAGTAVASQVFGSTILELGVSALAGAAMVHAGATVLDHLPHGSFFHATGGSVNMKIKERLKLIPYESLIGLIMAIVSTLIFGVLKLYG